MQQPIEMSYRNEAPIANAFHSHPYYEIYYFQEGECTYLIGDKLMALRPGDLILMHGMTLHSPNPSPNAPYIRSIVHFDPAYVHQLLQAEPAAALLQPFEELRNIRIALPEAERLEMERMLSEMAAGYRSWQWSSGSRPSRLGRFEVRFLELLQRIGEWCAEPVSERAHGSSHERLVQDVVSYLEAHYRRDISLDDIAAAMHVAKPYLSNLFKRITGTTIFKYLYQRRINQAKILFRFEPQRSVTSVCREVGFVHLAHFSRLFKETAGMSPEAYRKRIAEIPNSKEESHA
ncbi:helix-turn-helix transcriptional regulator [Cohnella lubricantis]|uniref:Helix-turn-helix transcriptional regulator n=2 Tax=Cohnella lubricantis TaxID=2163172 RepID=A0A841T2B1_9BACL|nr:AraC family transcriptional regulator [Cohnella lubricantis]MBB6675713.1 helix-turn-helix transcriptional regulator [Cohnella lubricantis]